MRALRSFEELIIPTVLSLSIPYSLLPLLKSKKIKLKRITWLILSFLVLGVFSSCLKNEICSPVLIELQAGIYTFEEKDDLIDTIPASINIDTLSGLFMGGNYLLLDEKDIELLSLPLNNSINESSYIFSFGEIKDTIHFTYDKQVFFNSVKCGVSYTYTITNIDFSTNLLQDIILINPEIDVISTENIQLVF